MAECSFDDTSISGEKILGFSDLPSIRAKHKGRTVVHCHGVFDLLHYGHVLHLQSAKSFGDLLVVTITADEHVNKGPGRPYFTAKKRAYMLAALGFVDYVAVNNQAKATAAIGQLKPDFYVKGADYRKKEEDRTGGIIEEEAAVSSAGGKLVFTEDPLESSTQLLNAFFDRWNPEQAKAVKLVREVFSVTDVVNVIDQLEGKKVLVVGEPIVDEYVYCRAQNMASKSPIISTRHEHQERYPGGSLAIANHLAELQCNVTLLFPCGSEPEMDSFLAASMHPSIRMEPVEVPSHPTPLKTRFINTGHHEKLFEITHLADDLWTEGDDKRFQSKLKSLSSEQDLVLVTDFGHGLFEGPILNCLNGIKPFVALGVQSNSANMGYNYFTKHVRHDYLCLDQREYRLAMQDRHSPIEYLMESAVGRAFQLPAAVTLGPDGSIFYDGDGNAWSCPVFFEDVIDTTGAGDAYLALTSILVQQSVAPRLVPFLGNCIAGLGTRIVGNKAPVSKVDLVRTISSILG